MGISYVLQELPLEFETGWIPKSVELNVMKIWQIWLKQTTKQIERLEQANPVIIAGLQRDWVTRMNKTVASAHLKKFVEQRYITEENRQNIVKSID